MENQSYVESVKRASIVQSFLPRFMGGCFWTFINRDSRLLYGTFSGVVKSDLWQSNNVLCVLFAPIVLVMIISSKINSLSASMASFLFLFIQL